MTTVSALDDFDNSVKKLFQIISDVATETNASSKTQFVLYMSKFSANYYASQNPEFFVPMFIDLFNTYSCHFVSPVYHNDEINHGWILNYEKTTGATGKKSMFPPPPGVAVFFDKNDSKLNPISLSLSEAYKNASDQYEKMKKKNILSDLPCKMLLWIYSCVLHALRHADSDKFSVEIKAIQSNVKTLEGFVEIMSTKKESSTTGRGLDGITGFLSNMAEKFNGNKVKGILEQVFNAENKKKLDHGLSIIKESVGDSRDIGGMMSGIGRALDHPEIKGALSEVLAPINPLLNSFAGPESTAGTSSTMDPSLQE